MEEEVEKSKVDEPETLLLCARLDGLRRIRKRSFPIETALLIDY